MHELVLTQSVVASVEERLGATQVTRVVLEIGALAGVDARAIRFCFDLCVRETSLAGAVLEIIETPGRALCLECGAGFSPVSPILLCSCGSANVRLIAGQELKIKQVEAIADV